MIMLLLTFLQTQGLSYFLMNIYFLVFHQKKDFNFLKVASTHRLIIVIYISFWLLLIPQILRLCHVHTLKKILIKESNHDIHLPYFIITIYNNSLYNMNRFEYCNWRKCFIIVYIMNLLVAIINQSCLICSCQNGLPGSKRVGPDGPRDFQG